MLAMADQHGEVSASVPGLAAMANVSVEACEGALEALSSPDKYSRTPDNEGRRIAACDGGWRLLNHAKYRHLASAEDRRAKDADRKRRQRAAAKRGRGKQWANSPVPDCCQRALDALERVQDRLEGMTGLP